MTTMKIELLTSTKYVNEEGTGNEEVFICDASA